MPAALLLEVDGQAGRVRVAAADPVPAGPVEADLDDLIPVRDALTAELAIRLQGDEADRIGAALQIDVPVQAALLIPARHPARGHGHVLLLADDNPGGFPSEEVEPLASFVTAATASLSHVAALEQGSLQVERQSSLARAAKALNESLDLGRVLPRICEEAALILDADAVAVYRGSAGRGLVMEACSPALEIDGRRLEPGSGLAGKAIARGRPLMTNDYANDVGPDSDLPFDGVRSALAAPMRWEGEARGVLWVGWTGERPVSEGDLMLLESFAELGAVACRNASVHAGLAEAARTDGLTGCLNHAALHETLRREMQRSRRTGRRLSIVLVDLDHFKQVNEVHGHLMGDDVLRRVARALREAVRPYDFVARYGGDEFAIVAVDAHEERAAEIGERAIARIGHALDEVLGDDTGPHATAGVCEWAGASSPSDLVQGADRALLYGKQQGVRGHAVRATTVPESFVLGRPLSSDDAPPPEAVVTAEWPSDLRRETEPLRKHTSQLAVANRLAARIAQMTDVAEIADAAVEELQDAFGYELCAVVTLGPAQSLDAIALRGAAFDGPLPRRWRELRDTDVVERCLIERSPALVSEPERRFGRAAAGTAGGSELALPIWAGPELWGALDLQSSERDAFEEGDVRLLEDVAHQIGSALRSATQYEQLESAYLSTVAALTGALEASEDGDLRERVRSVVQQAETVGRRLGMSPDELRDLRYAAALRDVGKATVPGAVLNKAGPLTEDERRVVERHALETERILAEVEFLSGALPLLRHCRERWDGAGYPDGLAGEGIPLGARVLGVCDAHAAMMRDRPYRRALSPDGARDEIRSCAGVQFDSRVTAAFLAAFSEPEPAHPVT